MEADESFKLWRRQLPWRRANQQIETPEKEQQLHHRRQQQHISRRRLFEAAAEEATAQDNEKVDIVEQCKKYTDASWKYVGTEHIREVLTVGLQDFNGREEGE